jgi:DNA-binding response OmpR family regulator
MPLIALTGCVDAVGEAEVLDAGADAYLRKPVSVGELDLRIRTLVRRSSRCAPAMNTERLVIRPDAGQVQLGDRVIHLDPVDMRLLVELASSPLVVHSRSQLRERVFGAEAWVATAALERHIRRLRAVLEPEPKQPRHIVAVRGIGYRFVP